MLNIFDWKLIMICYQICERRGHECRKWWRPFPTIIDKCSAASIYYWVHAYLLLTIKLPNDLIDGMRTPINTEGIEVPKHTTHTENNHLKIALGVFRRLQNDENPKESLKKSETFIAYSMAWGKLMNFKSTNFD